MHMEQNNGFYTQLCSDLSFEGMVVEVCFGSQLIAQVNYEKGIDQIEIEFFPETISKIFFKISEFIEILEKAKNIALRCAKEDEQRESY